jgi:surface protein
MSLLNGKFPWTINHLGGVALWLDASDSRTITEATGVSTCNDKSNSGNHTTQATGSEQPLTGTNTINGLNAFTFDGIDDSLVNTSLKLSDIPNHSFFAVIDANDTGFTKIIVSNWVTGTACMYRVLSTEAVEVVSNNATDGNVATATTTTGHTGPLLISGYITTSEQGIAVNGNAFVTSALSATLTTSTGDLIVGKKNDEPFDGEIGEIIITPTKLSTVNHQLVEGYLAWKWGITADLPANHPYRWDGSLFAKGPVSSFNFTIDTTKAGSANDTFVLPLDGTSTYNFAIDWGDGNFEDVTTNTNKTHVYSTSGTYQIKIHGVFPRLLFNNTGDKLKVMSLDQWGSIKWTSMASSFYGCSNMIATYSDQPDTSSVTNMSYMFRDCSLFNGSVSSFDTSSVTDMSYMFFNCSVFNQSVSSFDTASVTNMSAMFYNCSVFNQSVSSFDTVSVTDMISMFYNCSVFNQSVSSFNTALVTNMSFMFANCSVFNQSVSSFDTALVTNMSFMFTNCSVFNQSVSSFNTASVTDMSYMFNACSVFNQSVSSFDTASVTNMNHMFYGCSLFNGSVSSFDTALVTDMSYMFFNCSVFNQSVSSFDTASVTNMSAMFYNCSVFNQSVSSFDTASVTDMSYMFYNCSALVGIDISGYNISSLTTAAGMLANSNYTTTNYDLTLVAWEAQVEQTNVTVGFGTASYNAGAPATARAALVTSGWIITDGGAV